MNNIVGLSNHSDVVLFDKDCIKCTFKNDGLTEHIVDCRKDNLTDFSSVLHVWIGHQVGSYRRDVCVHINDVCLFGNMDDAMKEAGTIAHNPNSSSITMSANAFQQKSLTMLHFHRIWAANWSKEKFKEGRVKGRTKMQEVNKVKRFVRWEQNRRREKVQAVMKTHQQQYTYCRGNLPKSCCRMQNRNGTQRIKSCCRLVNIIC